MIILHLKFDFIDIYLEIEITSFFFVFFEMNSLILLLISLVLPKSGWLSCYCKDVALAKRRSFASSWRWHRWHSCRRSLSIVDGCTPSWSRIDRHSCQCLAHFIYIIGREKNIGLLIVFIHFYCFIIRLKKHNGIAMKLPLANVWLRWKTELTFL